MPDHMGRCFDAIVRLWTGWPPSGAEAELSTCKSGASIINGNMIRIHMHLYEGKT